jgi:hypothetical protein
MHVHFSDFSLVCRPNGIDYLISSPFLHCYQTMFMLPFFTRTGMFDFLKKANAKASEIEASTSSASLHAENHVVGAMAQLKTPWVEHVRELLHEDHEAPLDCCAGRGRGGGQAGVCVSVLGPRGPYLAG